MVGERLEVRLDKELRRQLEELAGQDQTSFSETVRHLIAKAYEERLRERRIAAARRLSKLQVGEALEPEELCRLLDEAHSSGDLY
jgi:predicted transcriptional regulator